MIVKLILILILPLIFLLLSSFVISRVKQRFHSRLRRIRQRIATRPLDWELESNVTEEEVYLPYIGNPSCRFNAHSPYLRCAVNPDGPCESCPHYQSKKENRFK